MQQKMQQKSAASSENEKKAIVANEMATHFEAQIKPAELAFWLSTANECCLTFQATLNPEGDVKHAVQFLNDIGRDILPELINCKNEKERIDVLYKQIPWLFENNEYAGTKEVLADIGVNFMKDFVKYRRHEEEEPASRFLKIYTCFLTLVEMYEDYELLIKHELKKELDLI